jgi:hypothetical protein
MSLEEKLSRELLVAVDDYISSGLLSEQDRVQRIASFLTVSNVTDVFNQITDTEKMGFSDEEISIHSVWTSAEYPLDKVEVTFKLPNGAKIEKVLWVPKPEKMDKQTFLRYQSILSNLLERQRRLKAEKEEEERKKREEEEKKRKEEETRRKLEDYDRLLKKIDEIEEENEILKDIVKKKIPEEEVEEEVEEGELTAFEKEFLRTKVFDC